MDNFNFNQKSLGVCRCALLLIYILYCTNSGRAEATIPSPDVTSHKNLALLPEECGFIDISDKIRGGMDALINEFPWMALLSYEYPDGPKFECGGTVINKKYILTAAHCVVNKIHPLVGVRVGEYDLSSKIDCHQKICLPPVQDVTVEKTIIYPDYNATLYANDIALLRVSKINLEAKNVEPVCLPVNKEIRNMDFKMGIVIGWGFTDPFGSTTDILQKVDLMIQNLTTCIKAYKGEPSLKLSHKQLCVGGAETKSSCPGDSGGPLLVPAYFNNESRYVQHGIVSTGPAYCGYEGIPGIYTRVSYYLKWILDSIEP